jgi:hypothetical protein
MIWLLLPDAWRIELLRRPAERDEWLRALAERPALRLVDWATSKLTEGETLFVAGLDLAAAELVLKVPAGVRVIELTGLWSLPVGPRARFLATARRRVDATVTMPTVGHTLPPTPRPFLSAVVRVSESAQ